MRLQNYNKKIIYANNKSKKNAAIFAYVKKSSTFAPEIKIEDGFDCLQPR